jgi:hypothetical protein
MNNFTVVIIQFPIGSSLSEGVDPSNGGWTLIRGTMHYRHLRFSYLKFASSMMEEAEDYLLRHNVDAIFFEVVQAHNEVVSPVNHEVYSNFIAAADNFSVHHSTTPIYFFGVEDPSVLDYLVTNFGETCYFNYNTSNITEELATKIFVLNDGSGTAR